MIKKADIGILLEGNFNIIYENNLENLEQLKSDVFGGEYD